MGANVFFWQERQRLYYLLPEVASAQEMMNELLLARIEARHMHFLAKRGTPLDDLPEASVLQKTDIVPGAERGMLIGGVAGLLGGILVVLFPPGGVTLQVGAVLIGAILGALFGAWASSMAAFSAIRQQVWHRLIENYACNHRRWERAPRSGG